MTPSRGLPLPVLTWTLSLMFAASCVQEQAPVSAPTPTPVGAAVIPGATPAPGEPLALLAGGPILAPLVVPMWLDLQEDARLDPQVHAHTEAAALALDAQRFYLEQSNLACTQCPAKRTCRILDLTSGKLDEPSTCIETAAGQRRQLTALGAGWFTARVEQEGASNVSLLAWSSEEGSRDLLRLDLSAEDAVQVLRDSESSVILRSVCPLPGGCATRKPMDLPEPHIYRFSEADGLREIK